LLMHQTWLRPVERWPKQALDGRKMPLTAAEVAHCSYQTAGSLPPTTSPWTARRAANTQDYCRRLWCSQGDGWGQATDAMPARRAPSASILEATAARQPASPLATCLPRAVMKHCWLAAGAETPLHRVRIVHVRGMRHQVGFWSQWPFIRKTSSHISLRTSAQPPPLARY